jgi:hypothetical protein
MMNERDPDSFVHAHLCLNVGLEFKLQSCTRALIAHASVNLLSRLEDTLQSTRAGITEMQKRIQEEETQLSHEKARMEKQVVPRPEPPSSPGGGPYNLVCPTRQCLFRCPLGRCLPADTQVVLQLAEVQRSSARNTGSASQGVQENQQLKAALLQRQQRGAEIKRKLADTVSVMQDALKNSEETTRLLHELVPGLDKLQMQLMAELGR